MSKQLLIQVFFDIEELKEMDTQARALGLDRSKFVRYACKHLTNRYEAKTAMSDSLIKMLSKPDRDAFVKEILAEVKETIASRAEALVPKITEKVWSLLNDETQSPR